ncbi:hypothetical protein RB195_006967 [Necator americanus]|uniref:Transmembrane protein n=2 Tax=Necator americanus TaxID=51031 RepID=A0ABR1BXY0_NECAM
MMDATEFRGPLLQLFDESPKQHVLLKDGNASAVPIISRLGMALGVLIWSITACLTGWAGGRFGLFGMRPNPPASDILNYGGLVFVIIGGVLFSRINSDTNNIVSEKAAIDLKRAKNEEAQEKKQVTNEDTKTPVKEDSSENPVILQERKQRLIGFVTALIAGVFYGMMLVPVIYMVENPEQFPSYPQDFLPYMFSQNVGIFLTATAMFIGYALIKRNRPVIPPFIFLPSFLAGLLWGIAQAFVFIANQHLSQAVSFPIIIMLPGCVASTWSVLYFHEIKGRRNLTILAVAMLVTLTGAVLVGLSKAVHL